MTGQKNDDFDRLCMDATKTGGGDCEICASNVDILHGA